MKPLIRSVLLQVLAPVAIAWLVIVLGLRPGTDRAWTWADMAAAVTIALMGLAAVNIVRIHRSLPRGPARADEDPAKTAKPGPVPGTPPLATQAQLDAAAREVLIHELAHAAVARRLGQRVRLVRYGPAGGLTGYEQTDGTAAPWPVAAAVTAAGLLAPLGPEAPWTTSSGHGSPDTTDDAAMLVRRCLYAAAASGHPVSKHLDEAMATARRALPERAALHQAAAPILTRPEGGWNARTPHQVVPEKVLQGFLNTYGPQ